LAHPKKSIAARTLEEDDLSVPPSFPKTFYKLLAQLAIEFNMSRPQLALKALRSFAKEARKGRSAFHKALGSDEIAQQLKDAVSAASKDWWSTVPESERKERARKAAEGRWGKAPKSKDG
jgi:hypothetical protein